jgi:hypothetical protein
MRESLLPGRLRKLKSPIALFEGMIRGLIEECAIGTEQRYCESLDAALSFSLPFRGHGGAEGGGLASRGRPSITSCGRFAIPVPIMTRSALSTVMTTTGRISRVVAATGSSKSESEPAVARA